MGPSPMIGAPSRFKSQARRCSDLAVPDRYVRVPPGRRHRLSVSSFDFCSSLRLRVKIVHRNRDIRRGEQNIVEPVECDIEAILRRRRRLLRTRRPSSSCSFSTMFRSKPRDVPAAPCSDGRRARFARPAIAARAAPGRSTASLPCRAARLPLCSGCRLWPAGGGGSSFAFCSLVKRFVEVLQRRAQIGGRHTQRPEPVLHDAQPVRQGGRYLARAAGRDLVVGLRQSGAQLRQDALVAGKRKRVANPVGDRFGMAGAVLAASGPFGALDRAA